MASVIVRRIAFKVFMVRSSSGLVDYFFFSAVVGRVRAFVRAGGVATLV
jgi:hypothetical protein